MSASLFGGTIAPKSKLKMFMASFSVTNRFSNSSSFVTDAQWVRHSRTCRHLNELGTCILYGESEFLVTLSWKEAMFSFTIYETSLKTTRTRRQSFKEISSKSGICFIKRLTIIIKLPDEYIISATVAGGITRARQEMIRWSKLVVAFLANINTIRTLQIEIIGPISESKPDFLKDALESFSILENVKQVTIHRAIANVNTELFRQLQNQIQNQYADLENRRWAKSGARECASDSQPAEDVRRCLCWRNHIVI